MKRMDEQMVKLDEVNKEICDLFHRCNAKEISRKAYDVVNTDLFYRKRRVLADIGLLIDEVNSTGKGKHIFNLL
jgi:hypothetical protein